MAVNTRKIACDIISEVINNEAYLNLILKDKLKGLPAADKRFVSALCYTTLENLIRIDYIIKAFTGKARVHKEVKNALRIGVCQIMFFESVPLSAAVNESVNILPKRKMNQQRGFVNAVLRRIADDMGTVKYPEYGTIDYLSVIYSYPEWICKKFIRDFGFDFAEEILSYGKDKPYTCLRVNTKIISVDDFCKKLESYGILYERGKYVEDAVYIKNINAIEDWEPYKTGEISVQSEASMLCVKSLNISNEMRILDACAAPGGKTAYMSCISPNADITAIEFHPHRAEIMKNNLMRQGIDNVKITASDASVNNPEFNGKFDRVAVDAPCSALGLMYRKPDIKFSKTNEDLFEIIKIQSAILNNCANYVAIDGQLLYSTCTINPDENIKQVESFLSKNADFSLRSLKGILPASLNERIDEKGYLQLYPHIDGTDGFFMALMERKK